jgi:hypothetical protein
MDGFQGVAVEDVSLVGLGVAAQAADFGGESLGGFEVDVKQGDLRARQRQRFGEHAAQDAAGAGHDGGLAGQINL